MRHAENGQHAGLLRALNKANPNCPRHCHSVQLLPILLGMGGMQYAKHTQGAIQGLGVKCAGCERLLDSLLHHTMQQAQAMIGTRRAEEAKVRATSRHGHTSRHGLAMRGRPSTT